MHNKHSAPIPMLAIKRSMCDTAVMHSKLPGGTAALGVPAAGGGGAVPQPLVRCLPCTPSLLECGRWHANEMGGGGGLRPT